MSRFRDARERSLRSVRVYNFRTYFLGQALSVVGTGMQLLAQAWLVLELTDSASQLGLVITLQSLPLLLLGSWAGNLADRVDNRRILVCTSLASGAGAATLGVLLSTGRADLHWIQIVAFVMGIVSAIERPAAQAILYELVGPADLPSAIGLNTTLNAASRLIGPAVAGVLIATVGIEACFYGNAVSFLAVVVAIGRLRAAELLERRATTGAVRVRDGISYAWNHPVLRRALVAMTAVGALSYNFQQVVPSTIRFVFDGGPGALGLVQAISAVGSILGGVIVASIVHPRCRQVGLMAVLFGSVILISAFSPNLVVFAVLWLPAGLGSGLYASGTQSLLQRTAAPEYQGRIAALFGMAWIGTTPIGALVMGRVIDTWSARVALVISGTTALLAAIYLFADRTPSPA